MSTEELIGIAELEEEYSRELTSLANSISHPVLKALLQGIAKDSEKHALMYRAIAVLLKEVQPFISESEFKTISSVIDRHIETEEAMIRRAQEIAASVGDPRVKMLASAIAEDERKHHKVLLGVKNSLAKLETLTEKDLWEALWKDSPWHGTPGG